MSKDWFIANKAGLRQVAERLVERRGFGIIAAELYQNVMDTAASNCFITITKIPNTRTANLVVQDDDPHGFIDLTHAWTLFASSAKKADPTKAGRFNVGEKMVLSFCRQATIETTTGTVYFNDDGRKDFPRRKRSVGTLFSAVIDCTSEQLDEFLAYCNSILVRPGLTLKVNDRLIEPRTPISEFEVRLPTEISNEEGLLRKSVRMTTVQIFEPLAHETPSLYELGIRVVETGDKWHYNVLQKVPLNMDRDNVTPAYLRELRVAVFNQMYPQVNENDTTSTWVNEATTDKKCSAEAVETFRVKRYGEKSVAFDPSNPEANYEATSHGFTVIPSRGLTPGQRQNLYNAGTLAVSSTVFPNAGKGAYGDGGPVVEPIDSKEWTEGMQLIATYTHAIAKKLLGKDIDVRFVSVKNTALAKPWLACYGKGGRSFFDYNLYTLGKAWFDRGVTVAVDDLILHELAHEFEGNHLSEYYYQACTKLGALLKHEAVKDPGWFRSFQH